MYMSNQLFKMPLGKTIIARYIAAKAGFKFLVLTPAKLEDKWVGGTSQNWERAFEFAAAHAPCIIFFDELGKHSFSKSRIFTFYQPCLITDSLVMDRDQKNINQHDVKNCNDFLTQMNLLGSKYEGVIVLGATNR